MKIIIIIVNLTLAIQIVFGQNQFSKKYDIQSSSKFEGSGFAIIGNDNCYLLTYRAPNGIQIMKVDTTGNVIWSNRYKLENSTIDIGNSLISATSDSGYIIPCSSQDTIGIDSYICLVKIDKFGNPQWGKKYGDSSFYSWGTHSCRLNDGFAICGTYLDSIQSQDGIILIKTDISGNLQWARKINFIIDNYNIAGEVPNYLTKTSDNGIVIVAHDNNKQLYLIKVDSLGNLLWANWYQSFNGAEGLFITENLTSDLLISGRTSDWGNMDDWDVYLMKFNKDGVFQWGKTYGNPIWPDEGYSVIPMQDGGYLICAEVESFSADSADVSQTALIKTNNIGELVWMKLIRPDSTGSFPFSAMMNPDKSITIAGIDGSYNAIANITIIRTDLNVVTQCTEQYVTPIIADIPYLNSISVGVASSFIGETSIMTIDISRDVQSYDLCPSSYIDKNPINYDYHFYPNPIRSSGIIKFENSKKNKYILTLFNLSCQKIKVFESTSDYIIIEKNNLSNGMYFFTLKNDDNFFHTGKLIIE